jgi:glycolate oxidase iron-sulfur subunit
MEHTTAAMKESTPSSFDAHHAPEKRHIDDCVHCGFCLPACPTYVLWGEEMDSPRGRIYMIKKAAEGEAPLDGRFREHMDRCLGCMACITACPSGVEYNKLIEPTRAQIERNLPRGAGERLFRKLLFATFPYPARLRLLALPLLVYQRSGLQQLVRALGIPNLLPKRVAAMDALLPEVPSRVFSKLPASIPAQGAKRKRVGLLSGCVQQVFFPHVNAATARVLAAE